MPDEITFTIKGNQDDIFGNPIPYQRSTQASQWLPKVIRYRDWKEYVSNEYLKAIGQDHRVVHRSRIKIAKGKKIRIEKAIPATKEKIMMTLKIVFCNKAHGDCDNIYKGIADALFENDKYLACGGIDYEYGPKGMVEINIKKAIIKK